MSTSPKRHDKDTHHSFSPLKISKEESVTDQTAGMINISGYNWREVEERKAQIDNVILDLDEKLNLVLAKQEYEYLKGYNLYIKRKEKELRDLIEKLNEKNSNNTLKDEKIIQLEKAIDSLRNDLSNSDKKNDEMSKQIKNYATRVDVVTQERDFLKKQVMEAKR